MRRVGQSDRGSFANAIRAARARCGLTLTQAAEESGVSRATIARWESGDITEPSLVQLKAFIAAVDAPADEILQALGLLPPPDAPPEKPMTLDDYTDAELIAEMQRRMESTRGRPETGRRTG